jgi:beta-glucosidase
MGASDYFTLHAGVAPTAVPVESAADEALDPQINARVQQGGADVLFLGDSITWAWQNIGQTVWPQYYGARNAVNAGVPGDTTENALWRLDHGDLDGIHPKLAIVELGTNNLGVDSAQDIAEGIAAIVAMLRQKLPETKILLLGMFPRGVTPDDPLRQAEEAANRAIGALADEQTVFYLDLSPAFLRADGSLAMDLRLPDLEHLSAQGYQAWAAAMESFVAALLKS